MDSRPAIEPIAPQTPRIDAPVALAKDMATVGSPASIESDTKRTDPSIMAMFAPEV